MPRLTITLPKSTYNRLSSIAIQNKDSMSSIINRLIEIGIHHIEDDVEKNPDLLEQHCSQLIIQMNALIKNMSVEVLKFNQNDFDKLRQAAEGKYHELVQGNNSGNCAN